MSFYTSVRYGKMRLVGRFKTDREDLRPQDRCVVKTDRGKELGVVLTKLQPIPETLPPESLWDVVRRAGPEDLVHAERLEKESVPRAVRVCKDLIRRLNLPMKLTDVDYVFGGERIIFYFTSETRVDFRELVRLLAQEFRTRIELKQVGARDQARLIGDAGHCGLELCCRAHLKELGGITMDMAKVQKHTADPSKITGRCGKLLCCLRYEYTWYTESRELLPAKGSRVEWTKGTGVVVEQNMLLREVILEPEGGGDRVVVKLEEIRGAPKAAAGCSGCATPKAGPPPEAAVEPAPADTAVRRKLEQDTRVGLPVVSDGFWIYAAKASEVPPGSGRTVDLGGLRVALFNVDGRFHALADECPHQGGPLGEGRLEGGAVTCPWHQWKFDVATGRGLSVSGAQARPYEVGRAGEDLFVKV
ncbi:MAG TPA: regulatory iron-sulfur-containing complex subunit RicT [Planctomycetota bacterium]|nr:regulatory iron-sulfur-containing complex subunit RicT [Planctomycetota bacterium]